MMDVAVNASRPEVGSCKIEICGSVRSCTAIVTRRFSPWLMPLFFIFPMRLSA